MLYFIGSVSNTATPKCSVTDCNNKHAPVGSYCYLHKPYSGSYKSSYSSGTSDRNSSSYGKSSGSSSSGSSRHKSKYEKRSKNPDLKCHQLAILM